MNQWLILLDPVTNNNVAALVWVPSTGEILHRSSDPKYANAIEILLERGRPTRTVMRNVGRVIAAIEEDIPRDDSEYLISFVHPILRPTKIGSRGTSHSMPSDLIEYLSNYLPQQS